MLIVCPQCSASYQVTAASLGADGRSVRCVNCQTVWFATPVEPALESAATDMSFAPPPGAGTDMGAFEPPAFPEPAGEMPGDFAAGVPDRMISGDGSDSPGGFRDDLASADIAAIPGEAEPAMMDAAPSIVPPIEDASALRYAAPLPGEDIESLAARREAARTRHQFWRRLKLKMPNLMTLIVILGGVILVLVAARNQIVKYAPQTASFYSLIGLPVNLRGLDFENIRVTRDLQDGIPVLVVEGKIVSTTKGIAEVPRLRFAIHDPAGKEIYTWTMMPSRTLLASGETLPFRSRLASPPAEGRDVSIRFFNRKDAMSGFR
jgi:predicted Zn finger-like uncharacterized protein